MHSTTPGRARPSRLLLACGALALASVGDAQAPCRPARTPADLTSEDAAALRQAFQAEQHAVRPAPDGHRAANPGQGWRIHFDGRGFTTRPAAKTWSWGLELERYGFPGQEHEVTRPASVRAGGCRMTYAWNDGLEEWYVNDTRGLEHGFTVLRRPGAPAAGESNLLRFTLGVRGPLSPVVRSGGHDVDFVFGEGATVVTYTKLLVLDADGRRLPARFERVADDLCLTVDERGARYPLTIDPVAQEAYLKASNTGADDRFGWSVSVSGDTAVVGAPLESSGAQGVDGDQDDDGAPFAGAAYVFVRNGTSWSQQAYLKASNGDADDRFGESVCVSGDTVVVGAPLESSAAQGVDGDQSDDSAPLAGAAYVFVRNGASWTQQAYLKASNAGRFDRFGEAVGVSGDTAVVGAAFEESDSTGVNGDESNNSAYMSGAAYVFTRTGSTWSQQAYLKASNTDPEDSFGEAVGVSGDTLVIGAHGEDSAATGVDGNQGFGASQSGAAYVFVRNGASWSQQAYLKASNTDPSDWFGESVAISGDTVLVGAPFEDSRASGLNGDDGDNTLSESGAAYVFVRSGSSWSQQAYVKASNSGFSDLFGWSVAVAEDRAVIGARDERSDADGVGGDQDDNGALDAGAAYLFARSGDVWSQLSYLKASSSQAEDRFGASVSVSGDSILIGAFLEDGGATGVNGDPSDDTALDSGAAYVFALEAAECFLVMGSSPSAGFFDGAGHTWTTQVSDISSFYPVLLNDIPVFQVPLGPGKKRQATPTRLGDVYVQVLMWNPTVFPTQPEQWSRGLKATLWSDGSVTARHYGSRSGMVLDMETFTTNGRRYVRFPFSILGF